MQGIMPRPVNQEEAQSEEASSEITNGSTRQQRMRGEMYSDSAYRVAGDYERWRGRDDIMIRYAEDDVD